MSIPTKNIANAMIFHKKKLFGILLILYEPATLTSVLPNALPILSASADRNPGFQYPLIYLGENITAKIAISNISAIIVNIYKITQQAIY